jgi:hypothetical protein
MPLTAHADDLWSAESQLSMTGFTLPVRMTIIRLPSGGLLLHSPIAIDDAMAAELAALGPVTHIVAPSMLHHLFVLPAHARYPDALLWCAPGLAQKRADVPWHATLNPDALPAAWGGVLDAIHVQGAPKVHELVFLHKPSATLLVTDLIFHILRPHDLASALTLTLTGTRGKLAQSALWRFAFIKDRPAAGRSMRAILAMPFTRLLPCHGDPLDQDAHAQVTRVTAWMAAQ